MADRELDVGILGGGPAGCAAALTLRRYLPELSVAVAAGPPPAEAVGETASPGVMPLLDYLGVREAFLREGHLPAGGTLSAWGSSEVIDRSYIFTGRGTGWHLDRGKFDAWLLARAGEAGCEVAREMAVFADGAWRLPGGRRARFLIDATGRKAHVARRASGAPRRDDGLIAEARWFRCGGAAAGDGALVETVRDGWWYSATLPEGRAVAMFLTDADLRTARSWDERLDGAPATGRRLAPWTASGETAVRAAHSQWTEAASGDGWVAAGDAAAAFDPVAAMGIGFALRSGMEAARVAAAALEGDPVFAAAYGESVARIYGEYRRRLRGIYAAEERWKEEPFWERRNRVL